MAIENFFAAMCSNVGPNEAIPTVDKINETIRALKDNGQSADNISDTYHTFGELYHHRAILFATICNCKDYNHLAWKSLQHDDPTQPMYDGMFIVGIETPHGQATYHYDIKPYWDMFKVKELPRAPKFDGHTPAEAIERIHSLFDETIPFDSHYRSEK